MKKLLILILISSSLLASAQVPQKLSTWYEYQLVIGDSLGVPRDTFPVPSTLKTRPWLGTKGDNAYLWSIGQQKWIPVGSSGTVGVTGVNATASGALSVSGVPFSTSGTIGLNWTGTASDYVKGNGVVSNFSTDLQTVGSTLFAPLSHNHTTSQVTGLLTYIRNSLQAGSGIAYNAATGVISATAATTYSAGYGLQETGGVFSVDTSVISGGGGPGATPTLQQATDAGATTTRFLQAFGMSLGPNGRFGWNVDSSGKLIGVGYGAVINMGNLGEIFLNPGAYSGAPGDWNSYSAFYKFTANDGVQWYGYGTGGHTGTAAYHLGVDGSGNIVEVAGGGATVDTTSLSNRINQKQNISDTATWDATRAWVLAQGYRTASANTLEEVLTTGSDLANNHSVNTGSYSLGFSGTATPLTSFSSSANGAAFSSVNGSGVQATSVNGTAAQFVRYDPGTTNVSTIINVQRETANTAADGIGAAINFSVEDAAGSISVAGQLSARWANALNASRTSLFEIKGVDNAVDKTIIQITGAGLLILAQGAPEYTDNAAAVASGLTVGTLYRSGDNVKIVH